MPLAEVACRRLRLEPDGAAWPTDDALLLPVRREGLRLLLKIVDPAGDETAQADVLRRLDGAGAVRVVDGDATAFVMERLEPVGPTLAQMALGGRDAEATGVLCDLIAAMQARLNDGGAVVPGLMPLADRTGSLRAALRRTDLPGDLMAMLRWGADHADRMLGDAGPAVALHGDMHHFNAIRDRTRGWVAIDPKGVLGPVAYDYANLILNPVPESALVHDPGRMARLAAVVADRTGAAAGRVLDWVAFQGVLGLSWSLDDHERDYWWRGAVVAGRLAGRSPP